MVSLSLGTRNALLGTRRELYLLQSYALATLDISYRRVLVALLEISRALYYILPVVQATQPVLALPIPHSPCSKPPVAKTLKRDIECIPLFGFPLFCDTVYSDFYTQFFTSSRGYL